MKLNCFINMQTETKDCNEQFIFNRQFYRDLESGLAKSTEEQRQTWARFIIEQDVDLKDLVGLLNAEKKVATRFLWMLSGIGIIDREKLFEALPYLLKTVEKMNNPLYLTSFANYWLIAGVPEEDEGKAIDLSFEWLLSADTNITIKSRALLVLFKLTKKYPEIKNELRLCLLEQMDKYSKDFHKRAKKILLEIE